MAKQIADLTTIDLFVDDKRPGRPKTNPLPRDAQVRINKRNQVKRDKNKGLKRIEFKLHQSLYSQLDDIAKAKKINRAQLIEQLVTDWLAKQ